ncbi:MAG: GNAT family N-acetyltransferase [Pseudomonadota bacterium]
MIQTRWACEADAPRLAEIRCAAWTSTYAGVIPGLALSRMASAHDPAWWRSRIRSGRTALVIELDGRLLGYAWLGPWRGETKQAAGEIYELYLDPSAQGTGLGRRLFDAARAQLRRAGLGHLLVRALAENESGCRFYRAVGGRVIGQARTLVGGRACEEILFSWE